MNYSNLYVGKYSVLGFSIFNIFLIFLHANITEHLTGFKIYNELYLTYYIFGSICYYIHKLGHMPMSLLWFYQHTVIHHKENYPVNNFSRDENENNITKFQFDHDLNNLIYLLAGCFYVLVANVIFQLHVFKFLLLTFHIGCFLFYNTILHTEFHKKNSILNKSIYFKRLRKLHYYHHFYGNFNFGRTDFIFDYMFNTLHYDTYGVNNVYNRRRNSNYNLKQSPKVNIPNNYINRKRNNSLSSNSSSSLPSSPSSHSPSSPSHESDLNSDISDTEINREITTPNKSMDYPCIKRYNEKIKCHKFS